ncbi:HlyC/CorC family transporter [Candidatus Venteria ishoeyi]|uniref:Magnesium and cobalt efflux protein CorC n=1 Tax=Candidatus Venteria ishoeyi TaxID=1899563 RepID=A0A1H6FGC4_9GAMM|nr:HlyC/CorC family transporter [Candidatus Venteria ishoeyi]MDM8545689.1 HlyC/CorC family transporter [Candidatus Venteria ishoeyi]SEH09087.1 Hemolysin C [Candidatus Venteria ishoeyi]
MDDIPISALFGSLVFLIFASAFFSGSETSMMAINRYRLRHLAEKGNRSAQRVLKLLERPDRLIGVILLGNNFVNILASSIATVIAVKWMGQAGIPLAAALLTIVILIFSEVTPKTLAALHPERIAFPASLLIRPLLWLLYPLVWVTNIIGNNLLKLMGVSAEKHGDAALSSEELRTVVLEASGVLPHKNQQMLLGILDLEKATVEDIMVPRHEIVGIDINDSLTLIIDQLNHAPHTRLPLFQETIDNVVGVVHIRKLLKHFQNNAFDKELLKKTSRDMYFIPEGTPLTTQLLNFQQHKRRMGLVVDEYGDIQGLVTLEDILEEVVGEFTTSPDTYSQDIHPQPDGSWLVDASITIRELNRTLHWALPTDGPKTLNGLILEYLETIPKTGTSLRLHKHPMEIMQMSQSAIKMVRIQPEQG